MANRTAKLNSGCDIPLVGYGCWNATNADELKKAIKVAVESGYRHLDTAALYENEQMIGEALQELYDAKIVKREDLFLTTKTSPSYHRRELVPECLKKQLKKLKTTYVDLYLIHFPVAMKHVEGTDGVPFGPDGKVMLDLETRLEDTWAGMEDCVKMGLARSIGVANVNTWQMERLLKCAKIKPAVNQIESHPAFQNTKLIEYCQKNGVSVMAFSQFGSPGTTMGGQVLNNLRLLEDKRLIDIGKKYSKNSAQVILKWQMQRNVLLIPKSTTPSRIADNFKVWDFQLSADDMKAISAMDTNKRMLWLEMPGIKEHPDYMHKEAGSH